ncbi:phosphatidylglycerophosphatase A family protein [Aeromonas sp. 61P]|uniref:phosphatidylglycerophosphatase A family protein n=1 Tax=Aeromonas sp. 61P TaxID=3452721 RepID=UPI003F7AB728
MTSHEFVQNKARADTTGSEKSASFFGGGVWFRSQPQSAGHHGHLAAIPLYLLVSGLPTHWFIALLAVGFVVGIRICQSATDAIGMPDHGAIVWDEVIGFGVTMIAAPAGWEWVVAGFALFRLFDVLKPWPISWFDRRIHGGFGIMLDDLIAGLFALFCMQLLAFWLG